MTSSTAFWKRKREIMKTVSLIFFQVTFHSHSVHLWPETFIDSLSTLR